MRGSVLSVDLGGTKILIGEVSVEGEVLRSRVYPSTVTSQQQAFEAIVSGLRDYIESVGLLYEPIAIGIGVVGRVDTANGTWLEIDPKKSQAIKVAKKIQDLFSLPCAIGNDVYCATLAEKKWGCGRFSDNFIYMNIGTGIAAGCVIDGDLVVGRHFNAGEVGHHVADYDSDIQCVCGRKGCVELLASGLGIHNRIVALKPGYPTSRVIIPDQGRIEVAELFKLYDQEDPLVIAVIDAALQAVAETIMNMVRFSDPDTIILGGGVTSGTWFIKELQKRLEPNTMRFVLNGVRKTTIEDGLIGLKGAALLGTDLACKHEV
ncbi:ROK family protein [Paenibacillus sp. N3.4]|uniref:ROK family protein n=1 Tax=Paenibacillus sp. N3.4 TaxID=2603222 RepID=UPI0011C8FED5|nr:ROK family protein [Paenibacillus sp. N3.4]TXK84616.1 ROK family protein [Paenibacillus sp. N3.4]